MEALPTRVSGNGWDCRKGETEMDGNIIQVTQLPVIEEKLKQIRDEIKEKTETALSLTVNEETRKEIKKIRADLNRDFQELEKRRKEVRKKILAPYDQFEAIYKECVTDLFNHTDRILSERISDVENRLRQEKADKVQAYFTEYAQSLGIEWLTAGRARLSVTLSVSEKRLKEDCKSFIDHVLTDLQSIREQKNAEEILVEYKKTLNLADAMFTVSNRKKEIEAERRKAADFAEKQKAADEAVQKVEEAVREENLSVPEETPEPETPSGLEDEKRYEVTFTVRGTLRQLKELKQFLQEGNYDYE